MRTIRGAGHCADVLSYRFLRHFYRPALKATDSVLTKRIAVVPKDKDAPGPLPAIGKQDMHDTWTINAQRMKGTTNSVSIGPVTTAFKEITRHHLVNLQVLMNVWNKAVERRDEAMFKALAVWSAYPQAEFQGTMRMATAPVKFQKAVCWNPFNIVVGPSTGHRVGDPGAGFDDIQFRTLPETGGQIQDGSVSLPHAQTDGAKINVARQEFNMHVERLKRINQYMGQYNGLPATVPEDDHRANMTIRQLAELLKSDRPSHYPQLFALMRRMVNTQAPQYNEERDRQISQDKPARPREFSPDKLPGALVDPALWYKLAAEKEDRFRPKDKKIYDNRVASKIVPWVSQSYLPNIPVVQPAPQFSRSKASTVPTGTPLAVIDKPFVMLDRVQLKEELKRQLGSLTARAPKGLVVLLCGSAIGTWRDCEANVSQAVNELRLSDAPTLTWSAQQTPGQTMEIRIHAA